MKQLLLATLIATSLSSIGQDKNLYKVSLVQPKPGQSIAFETVWKSHLNKFYNNENKRFVYEVVSGENTGTYQIVEGPYSYSDLDKEAASDKVKSLDYMTNISSKLNSDKTGYTYKWLDTLSYNYEKGPAPKYLQTTYSIKPGKQQDFLREFRRGVIINNQIKAPISYTAYLQMFSGSKPQLVVRRALRDGFKELEPNFFPSTSDAFKAAYIKEYGQEAWDKRNSPGAIYEYIDAIETYLVKERKDLSSTATPQPAKN